MQRKNLSILVVDDNESARYAMARALRAAGYKTMEAASGAEALEFAEYVSAVILDIHLPDIFGWEVCRLLRARESTALLPVIHITAKDVTAADKAQSVACGANAFFEQPLSQEALLRAVDSLVSAE